MHACLPACLGDTGTSLYLLIFSFWVHTQIGSDLSLPFEHDFSHSFLSWQLMKLEQEMIKTAPGRQLKAIEAPGGQKKKLYSTGCICVLIVYRLK